MPVSVVNIEKDVVFIGAAVNLLIPVVDVAGVPMSLTGLNLRWAMRNKPEDAAVILTKNTPPITAVTNGTAVASYAKVPIIPTDTYTSGTNTIVIPAGRYWHGLMRVDAGNEVMIAQGYIWIMAAGVR